jgi:hypothetical protein
VTEVVTPLMWQLAMAGFTLDSADGRAIVEWADGHGRICPAELAPGAPIPPPPPPVDPAAPPVPPPPVWPPPPACVAFDVSNTRIAGAVWRVIDPTDTRLEKPALAEITWSDAIHAKVVLFVPPPPRGFKVPKDFVPPPPTEIEVGLPDVSRPPAPVKELASADAHWKLLPTGIISAELPLEPGAGVLPVLPAPEPPKPAPKLKAGEPRPTEVIATPVPGWWEAAAVGCDRAAFAWMFRPLLAAVPVPDPNPPKPAPKPKEPPAPPAPPPEPVVWMYSIPDARWTSANAAACGDADNGHWTGVRALP